MEAATIIGGNGGGIILCSQRSGACFLCLKRPPWASSVPNFSTIIPTVTNRVPFLLSSKSRVHTRNPCPRPSAAESTQSSSTIATSSADKSIVPDSDFTLAKVSFGTIGLGLGVSLLSYGFGAYFNILSGSEWSALMLTYGFPLAIIGMALKYAELKPVPCLTYSDAQLLRENCATPIQKQVRNDVIRYRYGDEQHLEEALKRIFQYGQGGGISRRSAPTLQKIREEVTEDGKYCLVLVFMAKALQLSDFEKRQAKFASFFGPGISVEIVEGEQSVYEVRLISNTTL